MIANHGRVDKYDHEFEGRNSRLDGLQAAVLSVKLKHLNEWIESRRSIASCYSRELSGLPQVGLPAIREGARHVFHLYVIRVRDRGALAESLAKQGIQTGIHYPIALPKLKAYEYLGQGQESMLANRQDREVLSLPMGEHLRESDALQVCAAIKAFYANSAWTTNQHGDS
jgi:dTDP-4-amino-4,6-dideoxygalactose transaminase